MKKPADATEDSFNTTAIKYAQEPFDIVKKDLDSIDQCRLALKKFLIITELVNSLKVSIDKLKELASAEDEDTKTELSRFKTQEPVCAIVSLKFPELKQGTVEKLRDEKSIAGLDSTMFYTTLPFKLEIVLEPELYSLFYRDIATPKEMNIKHKKLQVPADEDVEEDMEKKLDNETELKKG